MGHSSTIVKRQVQEIDRVMTRMYLYIYGGIGESGVLNDLWQFEIAYQPNSYYQGYIQPNKWTKLQSSDYRAFHTMFSYKQYLYIYLGSDNNGNLLRSLMQYNILNNSWQPIIYQGIQYIQRSVTLWDGSTYKYDIKDSNKLSNDQVTFNSITQSTCNSQSENNIIVPSCSAFNAYVQTDNKVYFFGGAGGGLNTDLNNDFWILDLSTFYFQKIFVKIDQDEPDYHKQWPEPRFGAQMDIIINDNIIFLQGGYNNDKTAYKDTWFYNIKQNIWFKMPQYHFYNTQDYAQFNFNFIGHQFVSINGKMMILSSGLKINQQSNYQIQNSKYKISSLFKVSYSVKNLFNIEISGAPTMLINQMINFKRDQCNTQPLSKGICYWGRLNCNDQNQWGQDCDQIQCENSICYYDPYTIMTPICLQCSNRGTCNNDGKCQCNSGFTGNYCEIGDCQDQCVKNAGTCINQFPFSQCNCNREQRRGGDYCQYKFCLNQCSNIGVCNNESGICKCESPYAGSDCSIYVIEFMNHITF